MNMIYTPRAVIDLLAHQVRTERKVTNPLNNVKIPYNGYIISVSMDSNHKPGDLNRSDIRVYDEQSGGDCTDRFIEIINEGGVMLYGTGETLKAVFDAIDWVMGPKQ